MKQSSVCTQRHVTPGSTGELSGDQHATSRWSPCTRRAGRAARPPRCGGLLGGMRPCGAGLRALHGLPSRPSGWNPPAHPRRVAAARLAGCAPVRGPRPATGSGLGRPARAESPAAASPRALPPNLVPLQRALAGLPGPPTRPPDPHGRCGGSRASAAAATPPGPPPQRRGHLPEAIYASRPRLRRVHRARVSPWPQRRPGGARPRGGCRPARHTPWLDPPSLVCRGGTPPGPMSAQRRPGAEPSGGGPARRCHPAAGGGRGPCGPARAPCPRCPSPAPTDRGPGLPAQHRRGERPPDRPRTRAGLGAYRRDSTSAAHPNWRRPGDRCRRRAPGEHWWPPAHPPAHTKPRRAPGGTHRRH